MSDKFKVIDHATFEKMQQGSIGTTSSNSVPKIRNSKYKRMSAKDNFNLMQFVKVKPQGQSSAKRGKLRKHKDKSFKSIKNKGKKRENGKQKRPTRLKKSILQYRQKKREEEQMEKSLVETENVIQNSGGHEENKKLKIPSLHSGNFREYCNCCKTPELRTYCEKLIREINNFQRRAYAQNEIKAIAHKRFVVGFRQVQAYLRINKIKLVIIATDCERHQNENVSLDETIENIKIACNDQKIPVVFAFRRREMAYFLYKKASIGCIGVIDYDGVRDLFSQLMGALQNARDLYESLLLNT